MRITIATLSDKLFNVDISADLELENFKVLCEIETGVPATEMLVVWNGRPLHDDKLTLKQYGIQNGEIVLVQHMRGLIQHAGGSSLNLSSISQTELEDDPSFIRDMLLKNPSHLNTLKTMNPPLADAVRDIDKFSRIYREQRQAKMQRDQDRFRHITSDPFNPNSQQLIEEAIRLRNIESNMHTALEFTPESFAQVHMLYVDCKVNGCPVKAFVDSGAQATIMSQSCAERCNIIRLVDKRWSGVAKGVGTQPILGRVHLCQIQIGSAFLQSSFVIIENQAMDMLLGLDMLKRHQCVIDLKKNKLEIGTTGTSTPFLAEVDLPEHARTTQSSRLGYDSGQILTDALSRFANESKDKASSSKASSSSKAAQTKFPEEAISSLTSYGFSQQVVVEELQRCNGNVDQALASLFSKSFSLP